MSARQSPNQRDQREGATLRQTATEALNVPIILVGAVIAAWIQEQAHRAGLSIELAVVAVWLLDSATIVSAWQVLDRALSNSVSHSSMVGVLKRCCASWTADELAGGVVVAVAFLSVAVIVVVFCGSSSAQTRYFELAGLLILVAIGIYVPSVRHTGKITPPSFGLGFSAAAVVIACAFVFVAMNSAETAEPKALKASVEHEPASRSAGGNWTSPELTFARFLGAGENSASRNSGMAPKR